MKDQQVPPRIVASIAIGNVRNDCRRKTVASWTQNAVGSLSACASITQDWEIIGWRNEAWFLSGSYTERHGLRW